MKKRKYYSPLSLLENQPTTVVSMKVGPIFPSVNSLVVISTTDGKLYLWHEREMCFLLIIYLKKTKRNPLFQRIRSEFNSKSSSGVVLKPRKSVGWKLIAYGCLKFGKDICTYFLHDN